MDEKLQKNNSYNPKIKIISSSRKAKNLVTKENFYEFKIFPEGGRIVENTINTLGSLTKDKNSVGVKIKSGNNINNSKK